MTDSIKKSLNSTHLHSDFIISAIRVSGVQCGATEPTSPITLTWRKRFRTQASPQSMHLPAPLSNLRVSTKDLTEPIYFLWAVGQEWDVPRLPSPSILGNNKWACPPESVWCRTTINILKEIIRYEPTDERWLIDHSFISWAWFHTLFQVFRYKLEILSICTFSGSARVR